jgi:hypothetical protein
MSTHAQAHVVKTSVAHFPGKTLELAHGLATHLAGKEKGTPANKPSGKGRGGRLMSRKYCKKTPCRRMGFTQKASCRPYKNCYTRRRQR